MNIAPQRLTTEKTPYRAFFDGEDMYFTEEYIQWSQACRIRGEKTVPETVIPSSRKPCVNCDKMFVPVRPTQLTCSPRCQRQRQLDREKVRRLVRKGQEIPAELEGVAS